MGPGLRQRWSPMAAVTSSSWPGASGPSVAARAVGDGPDDPSNKPGDGHDGKTTAVVIPTVSWPGLSRLSTTGGADRGKVVDGRAKPGHDTEATVAGARLLPSRCQVMTQARTIPA